MSKETTYLFGRFHLIHSPFTGNKKDFIIHSVNANTAVSIGDFEWSFFEVEKLQEGDEFFIYGCLVKYRPEAIEDVVDRNRHTFSKASIPDKVVAKSQFVLHPHSGVIAYHPVANKISSNQFRNNFSRVIETANNNLLIQAAIEVIDEETEIIEALKTLSSIHYISLELHPSNPNNRERWKRTDERLQKMEVDKYQEYYESRAGIKLDDEDETYGNILMAADGYGKATIGGIKNGEKTEISTETMPVKAVVQIEQDDADSLLVALLNKFLAIWERMKK